MSMPAPPYSAGTSPPRYPALRHPGDQLERMLPSRSQRSALGTISARTNSRNSARAAFWASLSSGIMASPRGPPSLSGREGSRLLGLSECSSRRRTQDVAATGELLRHQVHDGIDRAEVVDQQIVVLHLQVELLLHEHHQLHGEERIDKPEREDVVVVLEFIVLEIRRDEGLGFLPDLIGIHALNLQDSGPIKDPLTNVHPTDRAHRDSARVRVSPWPAGCRGSARCRGGSSGDSGSGSRRRFSPA